jgi:hypothetical protein
MQQADNFSLPGNGKSTEFAGPVLLLHLQGLIITT